MLRCGTIFFLLLLGLCQALDLGYGGVQHSLQADDYWSHRLDSDILKTARAAGNFDRNRRHHNYQDYDDDDDDDYFEEEEDHDKNYYRGRGSYGHSRYPTSSFNRHQEEQDHDEDHYRGTGPYGHSRYPTSSFNRHQDDEDRDNFRNNRRFNSEPSRKYNSNGRSRFRSSYLYPYH